MGAEKGWVDHRIRDDTTIEETAFLRDTLYRDFNGTRVYLRRILKACRSHDRFRVEFAAVKRERRS
jgi:hypothetical protein